jgi:hypothetical protein
MKYTNKMLMAVTLLTAAMLLPAHYTWALELSNLRVPVLKDATTGKRFAQKVNRPANEYDIKPLPSAIPLPGMPQYSGKTTFVCGGFFPNAVGGPTYYLRFRAKEDSHTVLNWYRAAMTTYRWGFDNSATRSDAITAVLPGVGLCHVQTVPVVVEGGYKCEYLIEYKQGRAMH